MADHHHIRLEMTDAQLRELRLALHFLERETDYFQQRDKAERGRLETAARKVHDAERSIASRRVA